MMTMKVVVCSDDDEGDGRDGNGNDLGQVTLITTE